MRIGSGATLGQTRCRAPMVDVSTIRGHRDLADTYLAILDHRDSRQLATLEGLNNL